MMDAFILYHCENVYGVYLTIEEIARIVSENGWMNEWTDEWTVKPLIFAGDDAMASDAEQQVKDYIEEWY